MALLVGGDGADLAVILRSRPTALANGSPFSRPAFLWNGSRADLVCDWHAPAAEPYWMRVIAEMERLDWFSRTRFLIGARWWE